MKPPVLILLAAMFGAGYFAGSYQEKRRDSLTTEQPVASAAPADMPADVPTTSKILPAIVNVGCRKTGLIKAFRDKNGLYWCAYAN
jgi:hypothetical protein